MNNKYFKIEIIVAKIYLFCLPFLMINSFSFFKGFGTTTKYLDCIFNLVGILFLFLRSKHSKAKEGLKNNKLFRFVLISVIVTNITSFVMAVYIDNTYGLYAGESSYSAVLHTFMHFIQFILIILYNKEIYKMLGSKVVNDIISKSITILLIIAYIQFFIVLGVNWLAPIYNTLDIFDILVDDVAKFKMPLTETEGALAGNLLSMFVLPFLGANILTNNNKKSNIIKLLLFIPIIIVSNSLAEYILCFIFFVMFIYYFFKSTKNKKILLYPMLIAIVILIFIPFYNNVVPYDLKEKINYTLFSKADDSNNGSTVQRTIIPLKYNIGVFKKYPIFGIGNGNQGYLFYDFVDSSYANVPGVKTFYLNASKTIYNGISFFPSILSGYGILGILLLIIYIFKAKAQLIENKDNNMHLYYMYNLAKFSILIAGFQTLFVGCYYLWFTISIPFIFKTKDDYLNTETA